MQIDYNEEREEFRMLVRNERQLLGSALFGLSGFLSSESDEIVISIYSMSAIRRNRAFHLHSRELAVPRELI